eukprot:TRINITY_DN5347_c1_g1_i1.p1 TRINITY_DN5347_c1_g1~~TRINITY_DN5347_c1_g1_i1.p1  ORF type:complete len:514 (-),score=54.46 TRINITY_DN5347_c1_g1_i1:1730-3271(-)
MKSSLVCVVFLTYLGCMVRSQDNSTSESEVYTVRFLVAPVDDAKQTTPTTPVELEIVTSTSSPAPEEEQNATIPTPEPEPELLPPPPPTVDTEVPIAGEQEEQETQDDVLFQQKATDLPSIMQMDDESYGKFADDLVNCTDYVPQEQIDSGYENCSEVIDSLNSFRNLGLEFPLCESEVVWKWGYCQKTCGLCEVCEDKPYPGVQLECDAIKSVGLCQEMDIYQNATYCARSCQTCEVLANRQGGSGCSNAKTTQCDADGLLVFKSTMSQAAQEELSSWIESSNPCTDNWKGVSCDGDGFRVVKVQLGDYIRTKKICTCEPFDDFCGADECHKYQNGTGYLKDTMFGFQDSNGSYVAGMYTSIPAELSQLMYLEVLELTGNEITGTIPPEMSILSKMRHLVLFDNKINGTIPSELSTFVNMDQEMHFGSNDLSGSIPVEFSQLKFWGLYLEDNYLSGIVPDQFTAFGDHLHVFSLGPQYDEKLCISNITAEYLEANVQLETDIGSLSQCQPEN